NRDEPVKWVCLTKIPRNLRPFLHLRPVVIGKSLREVVREIRLACDAPYDGICAVPRDEVAPVLLCFLDTHQGHEVAARAHDTGRQTLLNEVAKPLVSGVEVFRPDPYEILLPGKTRLVRAARIERGHVRIESRNNLNHRKALLNPVGRERLELIGPME